MAEFKKLSDVEVLDNVPAGAKVIINDSGKIKQCPANFGGGGGAKPIILEYNNNGRAANTLGSEYHEADFYLSDDEENLNNFQQFKEEVLEAYESDDKLGLLKIYNNYKFYILIANSYDTYISPILLMSEAYSDYDPQSIIIPALILLGQNSMIIDLTNEEFFIPMSTEE